MSSNKNTVYTLSDGTTGTVAELAEKVPGGLPYNAMYRRLQRTLNAERVLRPKDSPSEKRKSSPWMDYFSLPGTPEKR